MGRWGLAKRVFAGSNSAYGFYSFYEGLLDGDWRRVFIIKGGPGTGKSTLMRHIAEDLLASGYDIEFLHCSADNESIDGFLAPALGVVMVDGTAPHVLDPRLPGAVDTIVNLGQFWDEDALQMAREELRERTAAYRACFPHAYSYLAAAKIFYDDIGRHVERSGALNHGALKVLAAELTEAIFGSAAPRGRVGRERRLFASAITPDGFRNYMDTIFHPLRQRYIVRGHWGTGKSFIVAQLREQALARGYDIESYFCALDPHRIEHLVIPALGIGVITSELPHTYEPRRDDVLIDTAQVVNAQRLEEVREDVELAREMYGRAMELAIGWLARAKHLHDDIEKHYVGAMDFAAIDALRQQLLQQVRRFTGTPVR